jgi:GNAT superfamily N-acetyltransferase
MDIRHVTPADAPGVAHLLDQLGYPVDADTLAQKLATIPDGRRDQAFVAVTDGRVVGFMGLHVHDLFHRSGKLGRITAMVVDDSARGTGVGKALLAAAEAFFVAAGCERIEVTSGEQRAGAHAFYQARGFVPHGRRLDKPLQG